MLKTGKADTPQSLKVPGPTTGGGLPAILIRVLLDRLGRPPVAVELPNGSLVCRSAEPPEVTVRIHTFKRLLGLLWQPSIAFGQGYRFGEIEVDGDLVRLCELIEPTHGVTRDAFWTGLRGVGKRHSASAYASRENIHHHYDLGNDFYKLWLDEQLVYTCAYFPTPDVTLEEAQTAKMDLVCRKLRLQPGQEVIEAGFGWGALALHMAREYGVKVRAYNISHEQTIYARERAAEAGLSDRVEFVEDDWRNMSGECDAFVSVGMLEHVGPENYRLFGDCIDRVLRPHGLALIHTIGRDTPGNIDSWIEKYIFPGAQPPSLGQMMQVLEPRRFITLDVENLRLHYAKTLEHWLARFTAHEDEIRDMFDESFVRAWRLYLSGSIATFRKAGLQLFQVVFTRCANNDIPWTRRDGGVG
jgi:cyclopropane-fatty-acyl-phospholipid synthase